MDINWKRPKIGKEYFSAFADTFLIVVFTILPTILGLFSYFFNSTGKSTFDLYKSGEFLLYSVSFLGSAYIVFNQYKVNYKHLNDFSKVTIALAIIISISYTSLTNNKPNPEPIKFASLIAVLISILVFYVSQVISNKNSPDIGSTRRSEQQTIEDALN